MELFTKQTMNSAEDYASWGWQNGLGFVAHETLTKFASHIMEEENRVKLAGVDEAKCALADGIGVLETLGTFFRHSLVWKTAGVAEAESHMHGALTALCNVTCTDVAHVDDNVTITESWLVSVGFVPVKSDLGDNYADHYNKGGINLWEFDATGNWLLDEYYRITCRTRKDVRALARLLKESLNE